MNIAVPLLLALTLLLAPLYAAQPDAPAQYAQYEGVSFLCAGTFLAALLAVVSARRGGVFSEVFSPAEKAFLALLALAFFSIPARLVAQHGTGYFGEMLRGWSILAADFALFALARRAASNQIGRYVLILAAVAGSAWVADLGVQEYIGHVRAGASSARTFATSTPDFLAAYFVLLLPVTLALFLETPSLRGLTPLLRGMATLVLGVVLLLQLITLLTTGSRFALVSLLAALIVFVVCAIVAVRRGLVLPKATWGLVGVIAGLFVLGGAVFAKPVIIRLQNYQDNSSAFRLWTWRGGMHMALANPLLGTGVGAWTDLYPKYALTGFTRLAHSGYLQMADECGVPALLVLLLVLALVGAAGIRSLKQPEPAAKNWLPADSRLLRCGLIAAVAGGIVQNLIDSDWSVFFFGAAFWTLAGLAAGTSTANPPKTAARTAPVVLVAAGSVALALLLWAGAQGIGAGYALTAQAQKVSDPGGAAESYTSARAWDPLNGRYPSDQGYQISYIRSGDLAAAEAALRAAALLEPNSVNFRRLGTVLQAEHDTADALAAYQQGLKAEPNSVELLLRLARLSPAPASLTYYQRLSALETSPVGTARALGESVEPNFAYGDAALGDAAAPTHPEQAIACYSRAAALLEAYISGGGSTNSQRAALSGGQPDPRTDADLRALYTHVLSAWVTLAPAEQKGELQRRRKEFGAKFDAVLTLSSKPGIL